MCPSYLATRDEKDSTRGRARVLQEAIDGSLVQAVRATRRSHEALDLCLACKGCASDCPTGVDMATYKSEALHQKLPTAGLRRPRSHYAARPAPGWAGSAAPVAPAGQPDAAARPGGQAGARRPPASTSGGRCPAVRAEDPRAKLGGRASNAPSTGSAPDVWIWADSFTDHFSPANGARRGPAASSRLGYARVIPDDGLLRADLDHHRPARPGPADRRRARSRRSRRTSSPACPVVGLEPSCLATLRSDAAELHRRPARRRGGGGVQHARRAASSAPRLRRRPTSPVSRWSPSRTATTTPSSAGPPTSGCSRGPARRSPGSAAAAAWPATSAWRRGTTRSRSRWPRPTCCLPCEPQPDAVVLADGFSCRTQLDDLAGVRRCTSPSCSIPVLTRVRAAGNLDPRVWRDPGLTACPQAAQHRPHSAQRTIIVPGKAPGTESRQEREPPRCPPSTSWSARAARTRSSKNKTPALKGSPAAPRRLHPRLHDHPEEAELRPPQGRPRAPDAAASRSRRTSRASATTSRSTRSCSSAAAG